MELTAAGLFRIFTGFPFHHGLASQVNQCNDKSTQKNGLFELRESE